MPTIRQYLNAILTKEEIRSLIFFEIVSGIFLSITTLLIFFYLTNAVLHAQTVIFDSNITNIIISLRQPWLTNVMLFLTMLGSEVIIFSSVVIVIFLTKRKHRRESFIFSILLLMGMTTTIILKILLKVPRPHISALVVENSYSYPSGHALNSLLFYGIISYFIYHFTKNRTTSILVSILATILIFLIGISRIYLGVHHPSDVAAGFIAGFWLFSTTIFIDKTIIFFRMIRDSSSKAQSPDFE
jgi:undecaprenyl-diphosphatase